MDSATAYKNAADAMQVLQAVRHETKVSTAKEGEPLTVASRVDAFRLQLKELQGMWANCPQSEQDRQEYTQDVEQHEQAIAHLEKLAENHLRNLLLTGELIGLGYKQSKSGSIALLQIEASEWAFLTLDYETGHATGGDTEYRAVRFVHKDHAPDTTPRKKTPKKKAAPKKGIAIALNEACERLEETLQRKPSCQEVYEFLVRQAETSESEIIIDSTDERITWKTQKGDYRDTSRKTICNMVSKRYSRA